MNPQGQKATIERHSGRTSALATWRNKGHCGRNVN